MEEDSRRGEDRRNYPRVAPGVGLELAAWRLDRVTRDYLESVIQDVSLGGMRVATQRPFPVGTIVELEFKVAGDGAPRTVHGKAIVRWRRRWLPPRGMGLEFVEFERLDQRELESWLKTLLV